MNMLEFVNLCVTKVSFIYACMVLFSYFLATTEYIIATTKMINGSELIDSAIETVEKAPIVNG